MVSQPGQGTGVLRGQWAAREVEEAGVSVTEVRQRGNCKAGGGHSWSRPELVRLSQAKPGGTGEGRVRLYCLQPSSLSVLICSMGTLRPASWACGMAHSGLTWSPLLPLKRGGSGVGRGREGELAPLGQWDPGPRATIAHQVNHPETMAGAKIATVTAALTLPRLL